EWVRKFGTVNHDYLSSAMITKDGGLLLTGTSSANGLDETSHPDLTLDFNCKAFVVKLDSDYQLQWEKTIGGDYGSEGIDSNQDESGSLYILGRQVSHGNDAVRQMFIIRMDTDGNF